MAKFLTEVFIDQQPAQFKDGEIRNIFDSTYPEAAARRALNEARLNFHKSYRSQKQWTIRLTQLKEIPEDMVPIKVEPAKKGLRLEFDADTMENPTITGGPQED